MSTKPTNDDFRTRRTEGRFYVGMGMVSIAVVAVGFGPTILDPTNRKAPISIAVALHGAVFFAWLLLFIAQTSLVANRRIHLHRRLGWLGLVLAVVMVVTGCTTAVAMARRGFDLSGELHAEKDPLGLMVFQLGDLLAFSILLTAAVIYRRRPAVHKRLMYLATVGTLLAAPLTHIIGRSEFLRGLPDAIILVPLVLLYFSHAIHDRLTRGRIHPISLWVPIALFLWGNLRAALVNPSDPWRKFAAWLAS
jgi:hypothetical protein